MLNFVRPLWSYRDFIVGNVRREFQARYRGSLLGATWTIINPAAMIAVYTIIFSQLMQARLPGVESTLAYSIYLCAGILSWGLFSDIVQRSQVMFIDNANLIKKISFPRICIPISVVATAVLNFLIIFSLFLVLLVAINAFPGRALIALVPLWVILLIFAMSLGIILGTLNVFFRDVGQFFGIAITFWFWLTPIVYPVSILPLQIQSFIRLNPMTGWINAVQDILVFHRWPNWIDVLPITLIAALLAFLSLTIFRRLSGEMVDEL